MNRAGLTLLETLIALVILGLVVVSGLELLGGATRLSARADAWSRAVVLAEEGLEGFAAAPVATGARSADSLGDGFARRIDVAPWSEPGLRRVDVTVTWPDGQFILSGLVAEP